MCGADRSQAIVMGYDKPKKNGVHPPMKPGEMRCYHIGSALKRNAVVLDTFGGSGSTLIACERTGRVCRCVELAPKYCGGIRRRWAEFVHGEGCDRQSLTPAADDMSLNTLGMSSAPESGDVPMKALELFMWT